MEELNEKAYNDEFNKAHEEIHENPRTRIPVPKVKKNKQNRKKNYG